MRECGEHWSISESLGVEGVCMESATVNEETSVRVIYSKQLIGCKTLLFFSLINLWIVF